MGAPVEETTIINRCRREDTYESRLKDFLASRGATVRVIRFPRSDGGAKVGLDDFLASGHSVDLLDLFHYHRLNHQHIPENQHHQQP